MAKTKSNKDAVRRRSPDPCSRFWLIDMETAGEHHDSKTAIGPFKSYAKAENWLRRYVKDAYLGADGSLRGDCHPEEWHGEMVIVEERRRLKPVPKVTVSVILRQIDSENAELSGGDRKRGNDSPENTP